MLDGEGSSPPVMCHRCSRPMEADRDKCDQCGAARPTEGWPADSRIGKTILGSLVVKKRLGHGATGGVYLAEDSRHGDEVVVKFLHGALATNPEIVKRFRVEAVVTKELNIPQVVRTFDFGRTEDGQPYMTMEYVEGTGLNELMALGPMDIEDAVEIVRQVLMALDVAHARCVIHRDMKPGNIILARDDRGRRLVKILDFGFAKVLADQHDGFHPKVKVTRDRVIMGTPHFMSPEQARGAKDLDGRTDLYALGVMFYWMITGWPPFDAENPMDLIQKHIEEVPLPPSARRPSVPAELDRIILKMLEKDPERRYARASDALLELNALYPPATDQWSLEDISSGAVKTTDLMHKVDRYVQDSIHEIAGRGPFGLPLKVYLVVSAALLGLLFFWLLWR